MSNELPCYQWNSLVIALLSVPAWQVQLLIFCKWVQLLVCFFHYANQCFVHLGCAAVLPSSPFPSPLQTFSGCSWFVLRYSPSSGCRAKNWPNCLCFRLGVNATRTLPHDKDRPLQTQSECRLMSFSYICSSPPSAAHQYYRTYTDTTCAHARLVSSWHIYPWNTAGILFNPPSYSCCAAVLFVSLLSKPVFVSIYLSSPRWRHPCFSFHPCLLLLSDQ